MEVVEIEEGAVELVEGLVEMGRCLRDRLERTDGGVENIILC